MERERERERGRWRERLKYPASVPVRALDGRVIRLEASGFVNL